MAQTNFTPISLYYSAVSGHIPTAGNLVNGELALNIADGTMYYKNNLGVVTQFTGTSGTGPVASFSAGTTGLTPSAATGGAITLGGVLAVANGGTGNTTGAAASITTSNFTISEVANEIIISHLGTAVVSIDALGNIKSLAGVSAYTTP